jgi:hypothetical protein
MGKIIRDLGVMAVLSVGLSGSALAGCYDILGCTDRDLFSRNFEYLAAPHPIGPNCDFLWEMRNGIVAEHGYCFRSARGKETFGNEGCRYREAESMPLNWIEWANIATIRRAERLKSCPR